jgi:colanic acid biosynthesis glycosyl transferase WcaI
VRVLLLNQYFHPDVAASGQRITDVARALAAAHDVTAIVGRPSYDPENEVGTLFRTDPENEAKTRFPAGSGPEKSPDLVFKVRRVWSTSLPRYRTWGRLLNYVSYLVSATLAALVTRRPDVVVAGTDPPVVGLAGLIVSRVRRAPLVYFLWDIHPEVTLSAGIMRAGAVTRFTAWANRRVLASAAQVVTPTASMARTAVSLGAGQTRVRALPLWEDTDVVRPEGKDNSFARAHRLDGQFVFMYSGNIGLTQGLDRYLDLARRLADLPDFRFVFVGEGAAKPALVAQARALGLASVLFASYQPRAEMRWSLASADVLFAPNLTGLTRFMLPSKVYTFMASGRPFIAAIDPECDLADAVREIDCGRVVAPDDVAGIEREVRWLHAHPEARVAMGQRGRRAAEAQYSRAVGPARYRALVEQVQAGIRS